MLVGVAGSGKDTFIKNRLADVGWIEGDAYEASSDDIIDEFVQTHGSTYQEMWKYLADPAQKMVNALVKFHIDKGDDIIWNQTNLTEKSRNAKLQLFPSDYKKIGIVILTPMKSLAERLLKREEKEGKHIPWDVAFNMIKIMQLPVFAEGFDEIWTVDNDGEQMTCEKEIK